jgi:uncharacterized integral membrane protein
VERPRQDPPSHEREPIQGEAGAAPDTRAPAKPARRPTRTSRAWTGTVAALILLILLLVFILENTASVKVNFLGAHGHVSLGVALLAAAVAGGLIVAIIGAARIAQLKLRARRVARRS